ncbi:hypothetical protein [Enterocloster citroniae]|uniref:hypothetical protein n=1 Tax=Enterocloster citroniae TaxID=358743 RepID=UPI0022E2B053|nr:hypothetical protein [Enterocloster citroniae]
MKYGHLVKVCGKFYWPGEEVPDQTGIFQENDEVGKVDEENPQNDSPSEGTYKEWQLKAMNRDKLAEICNEKGIEFTEDTTKGVLIGLILERQ